MTLCSWTTGSSCRVDYSPRHAFQALSFTVMPHLNTGRGVWGRVDACICMAESLRCSSETITTLFVNQSYLNTKQKVKKKKKKHIEHNTLSNKLINTSSKRILPLLSLPSPTFLGDVTMLPVSWTLSQKICTWILAPALHFSEPLLLLFLFLPILAVLGLACNMHKVHWACQRLELWL